MRMPKQEHHCTNLPCSKNRTIGRGFHAITVAVHHQNRPSAKRDVRFIRRIAKAVAVSAHHMHRELWIFLFQDCRIARMISKMTHRIWLLYFYRTAHKIQTAMRIG